MARYYHSGAKTELDGLRFIDLKWLRTHKYLIKNSIRTGRLEWTSNSGRKSSVSVEINLTENQNYIELDYTSTDRHSGDKKDVKYRIHLTTTPCKMGGIRYWMKCPLIKKGIPCQNKTHKLYCSGDYFGCRQCHELSYHSKNENRKSKYFAMFDKVMQVDKIAEAKYKLKRKTYRGKPTRKYRLLDNKENRLLGSSQYSLQELRSLTDKALYNQL